MSYRTLSRLDLKAFDKEAATLVLEAMEYGWRGRVSSKGHAILRAPDGESTLSIARNFNRSTGANARADFDRWIKTYSERDSQELQKPPSNETESADPHNHAGTAPKSAPDPKDQRSEGTEQGTTPRKRTCEVCGREFDSRYGLNAHGASHNTTKHPCPTCGKRFKHLGKHMKVHGQAPSKVDPMSLLITARDRLGDVLEQMDAAIELVEQDRLSQRREVEDLEALRDLVRESGLFS